MTRATAAGGLRHVGLLCRGQADYQAGVTGFIGDALAHGDPVLAAVPAQRAHLLSAALGADADRVWFADVTEFGRNPASIIPAIQAFTAEQPGGRASVVCEPAWPGRTEPELVETARHEALVNVAFHGSPTAILCPYDESWLPPAVSADVRCTHPVLACRGRTQPCDRYAVPSSLPQRCEEPLPEPPRTAAAMSYEVDLRPVREFVAREAARAGLAESRVADIVLAVSEVAANTLRHTCGPGTLRAWREGAAVVCEVTDSGWIGDPMAGRRAPQGDLPGQSGLWVVNQVCDLVQIRTGPAGSTVRLSMSPREGPSLPGRGLRRLAALAGRPKIRGGR